MKSHLVDKLLSFGLVVAGLAFLAFVPGAQTSQLYFVAIVVIVGGVLGLVSAQTLAPVLQLLERQLGVPLPTASSGNSAQSSEGAQSSSSSATISPQAAASINAAPGTVPAQAAGQ